MTTYPSNLILRLSALDPGLETTPQGYAEHLVDRLEVRSTSQTYGTSIVSSLPVSNIGPVLLGGLKWYVWDEGSSTYVPVDIKDSLNAPATLKYVLTSDTGTVAWKSASEFWAWFGLTAANITPGAAGTLIYSNGAASAWGTPDVALTTKSVAISKLKAEAADAGKIATAQSDGSVSWSATSTARGQFNRTAELDLPADGEGEPAIRPASTTRGARAWLIAKTSPLFTGGDYGWSVGDEIPVECVDTDVGSGGRVVGLYLIQKPAEWVLFRPHDFGGGGNLQLGRRDVSNGSPVEIDPTKWKWFVEYV